MMPRNRAARLWALLLCLPALPIAARAGAPPMRWLFREGSGSVVREASGGCGLTMAGGKWVRGVAGPAAELNGRTDYLEALDAAAANISGAFTIAFWINPASWSDQYSAGVVSKKRSDATPGYVIYGDGAVPTKITLRIAGTAGGHAMLTSASDVDEDVWQHWAVTCDPAARAVTWYKNGKPDKRYEGILIGDTSNDTPLRVGHAHTWNGHFDGLIDTVEITHRAWSPTEVRREAASRSASIRPAPRVAGRWRVVKPRFATADLVVARCTVRDAGAMGDGVTDDTAAFQAAMGATSRAGGGTVFVPSGRYVLRGDLRVPTGVTLRGEWERPRPGAPVRGTVLMAYPGRGEADGRPFIALRQCTGLRDLAIWYPEQSPARIVPYPFCIEQMGSASAARRAGSCSGSSGSAAGLCGVAIAWPSAAPRRRRTGPRDDHRELEHRRADDVGRHAQRYSPHRGLQAQAGEHGCAQQREGQERGPQAQREVQPEAFLHEVEHAQRCGHEGRQHPGRERAHEAAHVLPGGAEGPGVEGVGQEQQHGQ